MLSVRARTRSVTKDGQHRDDGQERRSREGDAREDAFERYSAVFWPGRMPGMKEPCSRRLFAISSGRNISRFQKKQKKKISVHVQRDVHEAV